MGGLATASAWWVSMKADDEIRRSQERQTERNLASDLDGRRSSTSPTTSSGKNRVVDAGLLFLLGEGPPPSACALQLLRLAIALLCCLIDTSRGTSIYMLLLRLLSSHTPAPTPRCRSGHVVTEYQSSPRFGYGPPPRGEILIRTRSRISINDDARRF